VTKALDRRRAELVGVLEQLEPGTYRAILTITRVRRRRGRELAELVQQVAADLKIRRPRLGAGRAQRALPRGEP